MGNNSKRDSKPIRQYWTVLTEICCRMQFLDLSNRMIRQAIMGNNNLWVSVINKIKLHPRRQQQVVNERSKRTQLMLTNYKDQHRLKVIPNHRQRKKLAAVEDPKSTALALEQTTMLVLSELAHLTTDNSNSRTMASLETHNWVSLVQLWAQPWASAPATMDLLQGQPT